MKIDINQLKKSKTKFMKKYKYYHNQYVEIDEELEKIRTITCFSCETIFFLFDLNKPKCPICGKSIDKSLISKCLNLLEKQNKLNSKVKEFFIDTFKFSDVILDTNFLKHISAKKLGISVYFFLKNIELLK